jgi:hypothetical protein
MSRIRHIYVSATDEQKLIAKNSSLYNLGDMMLVWVNERDLNLHEPPPKRSKHELGEWGRIIAFVLGTFGALLSQVGLGLVIANPKLFGWGLAMTVDGIALALICWGAIHSRERNNGDSS